MNRMDRVKSAAEQSAHPVNPVNPVEDAAVFHAFAAAGKRLAELHVGYEQQPEYPLHRRENPNAPLNWRVEKMKLVGTRSTAVVSSYYSLGQSKF